MYLCTVCMYVCTYVLAFLFCLYEVLIFSIHYVYLNLTISIFEDDVGGFPSADNPFIFNGDMVDRGMFAFEIVMSLLMIKLEDPAAVHILRGNHETSDMNESYGFRKEILLKYDRQVFAKFQKLFQGCLEEFE